MKISQTFFKKYLLCLCITIDKIRILKEVDCVSINYGKSFFLEFKWNSGVIQNEVFELWCVPNGPICPRGVIGLNTAYILIAKSLLYHVEMFNLMYICTSAERLRFPDSTAIFTHVLT